MRETVMTPDLCKDPMSRIKKRITISFSSGEEAVRCSLRVFAHIESPAAIFFPAGVSRNVMG